MMCAIVGALVHGLNDAETIVEANRAVSLLYTSGHFRGRDGRGFMVHTDNNRPLYQRDTARLSERGKDVVLPTLAQCESGVFIANMRAEPTTEFVAHKQVADQQPYTLRGWSIVHNGTIANDKEIRTHALHTRIDSAAIVERLARNEASVDGYKVRDYDVFRAAVQELQGSFAILAYKERVADAPQALFAAVDYRPLWWARMSYGVLFASSRDYFPTNAVPVMLPPYSTHEFWYEGTRLYHTAHTLHAEPVNMRALVVCSGGMDSVVAAAVMKRSGHAVELIHFQYGSRAQRPEEDAVHAVAQALDVPLHLYPLPIYRPEDSPLLQRDSTIAGGEEGAEFAHEWVPARNLVMLSLAAAFAEARGIHTLALGNNLEEAGAYPDNEPEFIERFNDLLPFAVHRGARLRVVMPVGNLMKHEIVALGAEVGAPLHLTWSCYRSGEHHCGTCGPCYMRRAAYRINGLTDPLTYLDGEPVQ